MLSKKNAPTAGLCYAYENIGEYPVLKVIKYAESKIKKKPASFRKVGKKFKLSLQSIKGDCARTKGYFFNSGIDDWHSWCDCEWKCGLKWSFNWLVHLHCCYKNQTKVDQKTTLQQLIHINGTKPKYFLMDKHLKKHQVCKAFFCKVYHISPKTLVQECKKWKNSPLSSSPPEKRGKWDRTKPYKNKANKSGFITWVKQQKVSISHFTRRLDKKMVVYFIEFENFGELYEKYQQNQIENNQKPICETEARIQMKKIFKRRRFKKSHLDVCPVCLKLKNMLDKIAKKNNSNTTDRLKAKGTSFVDFFIS